MKLRLLIFSTIISFLFCDISARSIDAKRGVVADGYNFWLYEPDSVNTESPKPLVIFLHGASLCGNDLNRVRRYGTIDAIERGRDIDAYVIAPQNPGGSWNPHKVMNIVDWVMDNGQVDSTRIYVIGMSLGGYGSIDVAAAYPDRIAAAMAFCGGGTSSNMSRLNEVPLWIVHGTADRAVSVKESDKVVDAMRLSDPSTPRLIYDRIPGMNHSQPARFFYMPESYEWLFAHSLTDEGRPCVEGFDIRSGAKSAYLGLTHNPSKSKSIKSAKKKRGSYTKRHHRKSKKRSRSARVRR